MNAQRVTETTTALDPLSLLVGDYLAGMAVYNAVTGNTDEQDEALKKTTWEPSYDRLSANPPMATSLAGVAAAMRVVIFEEETCGCATAFAVPVLRAALTFLEADAPLSEPDDPLLALIAEYRRQAAIWTGSDHSRSDEEEDAFFAATARPSFEKLRDDCPPATTLAGALAAFRLVADEDARLANWNAAPSVLAAGRSYFEGRTG